jgi:hypothetical protein
MRAMPALRTIIIGRPKALRFLTERYPKNEQKTRGTDKKLKHVPGSFH